MKIKSEKGRTKEAIKQFDHQIYLEKLISKYNVKNYKVISV